MRRLLIGFSGLVALVAAGAAGFAGYVVMQPDHLHVERSARIAASPADLGPFVSDMNVFLTWNPWNEYDPAAQRTVSDPSAGVGAWYEWRGNDHVGHGRMEVSSVAPTRVVHDLEFFSPWQSKATITFTFTPDGDATRVVWAMDEDQAFGGKMAGVFMDMDAMLGGDFEKGLRNLAPLAQAAAADRLRAEAALGAAPPQ
jgi:hypothetical protein